MADPLFDLEVNTTQPVRVPRAAAARERRRRASCSRRPASSSASRGTCPVDEEHPVAPVDVNGITKYATEQLHLLYHERLRPAARRGAAHQRVRAAPAPARRLPGLPPDLHPARARRRVDHGVRRRRAGARLPLRRRRRRVPAARRARARRRRRRSSTSATTSTSSLRAIADAIVAAAGSGRVEHVPWPPDRDAIDIGSYFGDSSKAKRMLGWEPRTSFADGIARTVAFYRAHRDRGTCDRRRPIAARPGRRPRPPGGGARTRAVRGDRPRRALGRATCSVPRPRRSRPSSPRSPGAGTRSAVASGTDALRLALVALGDRAGRRGDRARVHRGADRGRGVRDRRRPRCSSTSIPTPRRSTSTPRPAAVTDRTRAVIPVHLYGRPARDPGPRRRRCSRTPPRRTARSTPRRRLGRGGVQLLSRRRTSAGSATAARSSPTTTTLAATLRLLRGATALTDRLRAHARSRPTRGCPRSRRRRCGSACARLAGRQRAPARDRGALPRRGARTCAGRRRTRPPRVPPVRGPGRRPRRVSERGVPFDTGVHYPRALTQQPAYQQFVAAPCPEAEAWAAECVSLPCFPELTDDEIEAVCRATPVNPAVEADLGVLPLLQRRSHDRARWSASRSATIDRVGVSTARSSSSTTAPPTAPPTVLAELAGGASRCCASSPTSTTAATAARCSRASPPRRSSGSSTPTVTAQFDPAELELLVRQRVGRRRRRAGLQAPPRRRHRCARVIGRVYHRFVAFFFGLKIRDTDCDFRLIRQRDARRDRARAHDRRHLRGAGAQAAGRRRAVHRGGRAPLPPRARQVGVLPAPRDRRARSGISPACGSGSWCSAAGRRPGRRSAA